VGQEDQDQEQRMTRMKVFENLCCHGESVPNCSDHLVDSQEVEAHHSEVKCELSGMKNGMKEQMEGWSGHDHCMGAVGHDPV
jgi:hypothetical protein